MTTPAKAILHERLRAKLGAKEYEKAQKRILDQHQSRRQSITTSRRSSLNSYEKPVVVATQKQREPELLQLLESELVSYREWNRKKQKLSTHSSNNNLETVRPSPLSMAVIDGLVAYYPSASVTDPTAVPHQSITPQGCSEAMAFVSKRRKRGRAPSPRSRATCQWLHNAMSPPPAERSSSQFHYNNSYSSEAA